MDLSVHTSVDVTFYKWGVWDERLFCKNFLLTMIHVLRIPFHSILIGDGSIFYKICET